MNKNILWKGCALFVGSLATLHIALSWGIPPSTLTQISPRPSSAATLPFFELMLPLEKRGTATFVPRLYYRKGIPEHFLHEITYDLYYGNTFLGEEIHFLGRKQKNNWYLRFLLPRFAPAVFTKDALNYVLNGSWPLYISLAEKPLLHFLYLLEVRNLLHEK